MAHSTVVESPEVPTTPSWRRTDIQGLRAIAVLAVIAYHAGLPIPGGFTGVDIFFVVSGYVITEMLFREKLASGTISLRRFYIRRFRRLMPALAVVVSATIVASGFIYTSRSDQDLTAQTGLGAMFFGANAVIAMTTSNYFDAPAEANPLLHTWSLSVEEQFYFVFPAILLLGWTFVRARSTRLTIFIILLVISVFSFFLAVKGAQDPSQTTDSSSWLIGFYSPLTRIWEFGLGALAALGIHRLKIAGGAALFLSALGVVIGVFGFFFITDQTPFPGMWTLIPVTATVLLLIGGVRKNPVSQTLSVRPMVSVGNWSYSLYLWHWPFIVFAIYIWPSSWIIPVAAAVISFVPALLSYHLVEQRFRVPTRVGRVKIWQIILTTWTIPSVLALALLLSSTVLWIPNPGRASATPMYAGEIGFASMESTLMKHRNPCGPFPLPAVPGQTEERVTCVQSQPNTGIDLAIVGDSHALALYPGFIRAFPDTNIAWMDSKGVTDSSSENFRRLLAFINSQPSIKVVILSAYWSLRGVDPIGIKSALESIVANGKTPIITDDIPSFTFDPSRCAVSTESALQPLCSQERTIFESERAKYAPTIIEAAAKTPGTIFLRTSELFCNETECSMVKNGVIHFADSNHVNFEGSDLLTNQISKQAKISELLARSGPD